MARQTAKARKKPKTKKTSKAARAAAAALTVRCDGMCGIVNRGTSFEFYLLPGHDHEPGDPLHEASLVAPIKSISTGISDLWEPDLLGIDEKGNQIGVWHISFGTQLEIGSATTTRTRWDDRSEGLDLGKFHPNATTKTRRVIMSENPGATVVTLHGGEMQGFKTRELEKRQGGHSDVTKEFNSGWQWIGSETALVNRTNSRRLLFRGSPTIGITNVARIAEGEGLMHYHHYYRLVQTRIAKADRVTIAKPTRDEDVYDCIPPAPLP